MADKSPNVCRRTSKVWMYFTECALDKAKCDICKQVLSYKCGSTFNLNRHLRLRHPKLNVFHNSARESDHVNTEDQTYSLDKSSDTCKRKNQVWMYFTECGPDKAKCNNCTKIFSYKCGSTYNLNRHLRLRHPTLNMFHGSIGKPNPFNTDNQVTPDTDDSTYKSPNARRRKSKVWMYYKECGSDKAKCNICTKTLSYKCGSTFNLNRHLRLWHPTINMFHNSVRQTDSTNTENLANSDPDNSVVKSSNTCWRKSHVWMYFTEYAPDKVKCDKCRKILSYKYGSTFNLNRHLRNRHPTLNAFHSGIRQSDTISTDNQDKQDLNNSANNSVNSCKRKSQVWMYFAEHASDKATCNVCKKILSYKCGSLCFTIE